MDESTPHSTPWLDEPLRRAFDAGQSFPVVRSMLRPVVERSDPWQAETRRHDFGGVIEILESHRPGGAEAVIGVVTDVEDDPVGRVQTAVLLARRLAESGKSVLLVDADLRHVGLSRWMADRDLDAEGLVDVLQYGASVANVVRSSPVEHVKVLAVGSYRPDGSDLFGDEDLRRLAAQLRHAADVVLVVAPAWVSSRHFHPLLVHGDTVLASMHLDRTLAASLEELLHYLRGLNVPVCGLITFSGPDASERQVDDVLRERSGMVTPFTEEQEPDYDAPLEPEAVAPDQADVVHEVPLPDEAGAPASEVQSPVDEGAELGGSVRGFRSRPDESANGSSPVVRVAVVALVVVILGFVGWWSFSSRDDSNERTDLTLTPPSVPIARRAVGEGDASEGASDETSSMTALADSLQGDGPPSDPAELAAEDAAAADALDFDEPADANPTLNPPRERPAPSRATSERASAVEDWRVAAERPVAAGYALHLFSFPDSSEALVTADRIRRQGFSPAVRGADIPDKGRWFRVLVGNYDDRASAMDAREPVAEFFDVDWVGVMRIP